MQQRDQNKSIRFPFGARPAARARIRGDAAHPQLHGVAEFFPCRNGTLVFAEVWGLPYDPARCAPNIYALHVHAGGGCTGTPDAHFSGAGGHDNPKDCPHPAHAGDLPPLFGNRGYAWQGVYTERFTPAGVVGKTVIVHGQRDDFTTQPAGDAGARIGCGVITAVR